MKKNKFDLKWLVVIAVVGIVIGGGAYAVYNSVAPVTVNDGGVNNQYIGDFSDGYEVPTLGASADYCVGDEATTNMCVVDIFTLTVNGNITLTDGGFIIGTTTIERLDATSQTVMTWNTTTYGFATADDPTVLVKVQNTGADMICTDAWLDVSTAVTSFGGSYAVGTTTATGDLSLTNTTTATLIAETAISTTTNATLNKQDEEGTNTEEAWIWTHGDYLVVSMPDAGGATSSDSVSEAGGFAGVGRLHVNCRNRF